MHVNFGVYPSFAGLKFASKYAQNVLTLTDFLLFFFLNEIAHCRKLTEKQHQPLNDGDNDF